jgi:hypothetical protein
MLSGLLHGQLFNHYQENLEACLTAVVDLIYHLHVA